MANVMINEKTYEGVTSVQIPLADGTGNAEFFEQVEAGALFASGEFTPEEDLSSIEIDTGIQARYFLIKATPATDASSHGLGVRTLAMIFFDFMDVTNNLYLGTNSNGTTINSASVMSFGYNLLTIDENGKVTIPSGVSETSGGGFLTRGVTYKWMAFGDFYSPTLT